MRSAESLITMSCFLSILTDFLQVHAWVHAWQQAPGGIARRCSPSTTAPLSRRIFPKHGLDPVTNLLKNAHRLPLPTTAYGLVQANFSALSSSPTRHSPQQNIVPHKVHGTVTATPGLQCSLCLLSCCFMECSGRRTITTAPNTSAKPREPYPG